jgi:Holliday junction resolvasome RuvABC DNA-binding subunit
MSSLPESAARAETGKPSAHGNDQRVEAEQALVALGYKLTEAAKLIAAADCSAGDPQRRVD